VAEGIRKRHSKTCRARSGGRCNCQAGYEAWVFSKRDGKKIRKTFRRESEAKSWRSDARRELELATHRPGSEMTLEQAAWLWLEAARTGRVRDRSGHTYKPATLREYARVLRLRVLSEFGAQRLADISRGALQEFVDQMLAGDLAPSTIRNTVNPLQALFRYAARRELVAVNPTRELELPIARGRRDRIATPAEAKRLLDALPAGDQPIWATAFYAGLRRGELQALRSSDIDLARSELHVQRSWDQHEGPIPPKSQAGTRTIPILGVLHPFLGDNIEPGSDALIFGRQATEPFDPKTLNDRAKRAWAAVNKREIKAAEEEGREPALLRPITMHECRHTFASLLIDAGVNPKAVQEFMGHATIEETFSRYGHLMPGARDQARKLVDAYMDSASRRPSGGC
jgi:integrase